MTRERLEDYGSNVDSTAALDIGRNAGAVILLNALYFQGILLGVW